MIEEKHILQFLEGTASKKLRSNVKSWRDADEVNKEKFAEVKSFWEIAGTVGDYVQFDVDAEWDSFQSMIIGQNINSADHLNIKADNSPLSIQSSGGEVKQETIDSYKSNDEVKEEVGESVLDAGPTKIVSIKESRDWRNVLSIAASVAVLIAATVFLWPQSQYIDIVDAEADRTETLADGTIVQISQGASFKTLRSYKYANAREALIDGEVNFDVASDPEKPFFVKTQETSIKVLGTKFNVIATGIESEVANEEGLVKFFVNNDEENGIEIKEGESFKYDGTGFVNLNPPEPEPEPEPEPIPEVGDVMLYLWDVSSGKITFGSGMESYKASQIQIDYKGKSASEVIRLLEEKAIVSYTTSCSGCYRINEIIPFK